MGYACIYLCSFSDLQDSYQCEVIKIILTLVITPAAIVCPPDRSINRPNSLHSPYNSKHTGLNTSILTIPVQFFFKHLKESHEYYTKIVLIPLTDQSESQIIPWPQAEILNLTQSIPHCSWESRRSWLMGIEWYISMSVYYSSF